MLILGWLIKACHRDKGVGGIMVELPQAMMSIQLRPQDWAAGVPNKTLSKNTPVAWILDITNIIMWLLVCLLIFFQIINSC